jgi:hypothetical protein
MTVVLNFHFCSGGRVGCNVVCSDAKMFAPNHVPNLIEQFRLVSELLGPVKVRPCPAFLPASPSEASELGRKKP